MYELRKLKDKISLGIQRNDRARAHSSFVVSKLVWSKDEQCLLIVSQESIILQNLQGSPHLQQRCPGHVKYARILWKQVSHGPHIQHRVGEYESPGISETLHALLSERALHFEVI